MRGKVICRGQRSVCSAEKNTTEVKSDFGLGLAFTAIGAEQKIQVSLSGYTKLTLPCCSQLIVIVGVVFAVMHCGINHMEGEGRREKVKLKLEARGDLDTAA